MSNEVQPKFRGKTLNEDRPDSLIRRSWHAMADVFSPFSSSALGTLPNLPRPQRYTRADGIPDVEGNEDGARPTVRDYHSISSVPSQVRVPKKIATPVRVEGKVWFANERSESKRFFIYICPLISFVAWVSWLNLSILLGTLSLALFNASKDYIARSFAYTYAVISIGVLVCGHGFHCSIFSHFSSRYMAISYTRSVSP